MFTDTHCHLYDQAFSDRKSEVQLAAIAAGVTTILLPNISAASLPLLDRVDASFPELKTYGMVGLHPCYVKEDWESELDMIRSHYLKNPEKYCAVGEIGMDLYWDTTTQDIQIQALETQLDWAVEWDLPIVLHVRSSFKQLLPVLEAAQLKHEGRIRGVFHCFSGGKKQVKRILKLGEFYFGLGGSYTYNRSATDIVIEGIPRDRILLETDAPYLTPSAFKGSKNEPAFMAEVAHVVAEVLKTSIEEVAVLTSTNAKRLFSLDA